MILLVDIGNSRIKSARWRDTEISEPVICDHVKPLADAWGGFAEIDRVIACNVAGPPAAKRVEAWCAENGAHVDWISSTDPIQGLTHCYPQPAALGDDRWLAMAGARNRYSGLLCVVDCGTAATFDVVDARGYHRGGAIIPGVSTMRAALNRQTHDLPVATSSPAPFSDSTDQAIAGGTAYALAAAVDRLVAEAKAAYGESLQVIIGGGEAEIVMPLLQQKCVLDTTLVLMGLAVAAGLQ